MGKKLYDQKVRGGGEKVETEEFDKIFHKIKPHDLGKLLFHENHNETKDLQHKTSIVKKEHHHKLAKATALLRAHVNKKDNSSEFPVLEGEAKDKAVKNLTASLGLKQMSKVVATIEGYENYSQKNLLSKALTRFVDAISRKFSQIKTAEVQKGLEELMTKGAKVEKVEKQAIQQNMNVTKNKGSSREM